MCMSNAVTINLGELKEGSRSYSFALDNDFFAGLDETEIKVGQVDVKVTAMTIDGTNFSLTVAAKGSVEVTCDRCLAPMQQPIDTKSDVKAVVCAIGTDDDDTIVVSEKTGVIDLSWYVYEQITLGIPIRHVHEEGQCDAEMTNVLNCFEKQSDGAEDDTATDPRWDALKNIEN